MAEPRRWKDTYNHPEVVRIRELIKNAYSNKLTFIEESHQYFLDGVEFQCVSNVVEQWSSVDEEAMLENCARKAQDPTKPNYKYHGMSKSEIKQLWEDISNKATSFGTECHAFGESMFYYMVGEDENILPECRHKFDENGPKPTCPQEEAIVQFWNDLPDSYIPVLAETRVFNTNVYPYAGTFDILFYYMDTENPENSGLLVFDYKTNASLSNSYARDKGEMMLFPFSYMYEESLSHYVCQLSLYVLPLLQLGLKVIGRRLIWLKHEGGYEKVPVPDVVDKIMEALNIKEIKLIN